jgi:hypothetical protein
MILAFFVCFAVQSGPSEEPWSGLFLVREALIHGHPFE